MAMSFHAIEQGPPWPVRLRLDLICDAEPPLLPPARASFIIEPAESHREAAHRAGWKFCADGRVLCPDHANKS